MTNQHLGRLIDALQSRLTPGLGRRHGRPTDASWVQRPKVPMSEETVRKLRRLAEMASSDERRVSPMQVAALILEQAVDELGRCASGTAQERRSVQNLPEAYSG
jgi:hypothetical protein